MLCQHSAVRSSKTQKIQEAECVEVKLICLPARFLASSASCPPEVNYLDFFQTRRLAVWVWDRMVLRAYLLLQGRAEGRRAR